MHTHHHNSVEPKSVKTFPVGTKLTVHQIGSDEVLGTIEILNFVTDERGNSLFAKRIEEPDTSVIFEHWDDVWHFMFPDPMTDRFVTNSRCLYDLRLSAIQ